MYFIFKLTVIILILYLKLIGLEATPLIYHNKSAAAISAYIDDRSTSSTTTIADEIKAVKSTRGEDDTTNTSINTMEIYNTNSNNHNNNSQSDNNQYNSSIPSISVTTTKRDYKLSTSISMSTNLTTIDISNKYPKLIANTSKFFYYDMLRKGNGGGEEADNEVAADKEKNPEIVFELEEHEITTADENKATSDSTTAYETTTTKRRYETKRPTLAPTFINELSTLKPPTMNVNPLNPPKTDGTEIEVDLNLGDNLHQKINNSDVDSFLLKYDRDDGNTCLLDDIKDYLMWWSYTNGSLRESNLNLTTKLYLDLSFHNITQDDSLYRKTRALTYVSGRQIIAFSAAHNNLTTVPFRTLSMMNGTLRFLTLKGNQFNAHSPEQALSRIMNDTKYPDVFNTTQDDHQNSPPTQNEDSNNSMPITNLSSPPTSSLTQNENSNSSNSTPIQKLNTPITHDSSSPDYAPNTIMLKASKAKKKEGGIAWATFPPLPALIELDLSNCHIEYVTKEAFQNLTNLRRLFIAHNKMLTIPFDTFQHVPELQYLDLSFTNVLDFDYQIPLPTLEAIINLVYGVKIQQNTFKYLPNLEYLDLSHTKLTRNSAVAFTHLGEKLRFLSLCYTAFPLVGNALFKNTALVGLDLSGNPYAAYNIIDDVFEGVADTLQYLYFESSNIKDLSWAKYLMELKVLGLSGNNINSVSLETFGTLRSLQILDLSTNHIGNWYNRAFTHNERLKVLNVRDNNINIITSEMLKDFQLLDYLSIGDNNFVCDCLLRDLVDIAAANNKEAECSTNSVLQGVQNKLVENMAWVGEYMALNMSKIVAVGGLRFEKSMSNLSPPLEDAIASQLQLRRFVPNLQRSYANMRRYSRLQGRLKLRFVSHFKSVFKLDSFSSGGNGSQCLEPAPLVVYDKLNGSALKFQLLDYEDDHYWCFNETERMHFVQLNCASRTFAEDITEKLHALTNYVIGSVVGILALTLIGVCIYLKRWHIHYYYSSLKSAALLSVASKESVDKLSTTNDEHDPNLVYDIFISYCQNDRQWVLEELLPNVEETGDISICMHERDFQIGLTILDNIMSCMDRSRALMLIISSNFLLSHWCQFEMHLAQHRIFEVSKEQLILVFLEDIPRNKRPKSLQYLMEVKTYIKWPVAKRNKPVRSEERKLFWLRLRRSLENIGLHYGTESRA